MIATEPLFRADAYLREAEGRVRHLTQEGGIVLDQSLFYATAGGQPGDSGSVSWDGQRLDIASAIKGEGGAIILVPAQPSRLPPVGTLLGQRLDWDRRYRHMRVHTALHLMSVAVPLPVTGGQISATGGRLDFDMTGASVDPVLLQSELNKMITRDLEVSEDWITDAELEANPGLIKTLSVAPPRGQGRVRLVRIGTGADQIDLQPCGGTHVRRTGEIGAVTIGKIENKGRQNRRITLQLGNG